MHFTTSQLTLASLPYAVNSYVLLHCTKRTDYGDRQHHTYDSYGHSHTGRSTKPTLRIALTSAGGLL